MWKRDETLVVRLECDRPYLDAGLLTQGPLRDGGLSPLSKGASRYDAGNSCCADAGPNCTCVEIRLPEVPFEAFNGTVWLNATSIGCAPSDAGIAVTRWRWSKQVFGAGFTPRPPAIDDDGAVYLGASLGSAAGMVASVGPDGALRWRGPSPPVSGAPLVGNGVVYVPQFGMLSTLANLDRGDGGVLSTTGCTATGFDFAMAPTISVIKVGIVGSETVILARKINGGLGIALDGHRAFDLVSPCSPNSTPASTATGLEMTMATSMGNIFYGARDHSALRRIRDIDFAQIPSATDGGAEIDLGVSPKELAIDGNTVLGSSYGPGDGIFAVGFDGTGLKNYRVAGLSGGLVLAKGHLAYFATSTGGSTTVSRVSYGGDAGALATGSTVVPGTVVASPLLGAIAPADSAELLYVATTTGSVYAIDTGRMSVVWSMKQPTLPSGKSWAFDTSPTADCSRLEANKNGGPGTLYLLGGMTSDELFSLIIDSHGLDSTSPWPKYQHDGSNTGNAERPTPACP